MNKRVRNRSLVMLGVTVLSISLFAGFHPSVAKMEEKDYRDQSVDQAMKTIRNRIDQLGVGEIVLQKHGGPGQNEILVQLPGVDDPARVKNIMQSQAQLELKLVDSGPFPNQAAAAQN